MQSKPVTPTVPDERAVLMRALDIVTAGRRRLSTGLQSAQLSRYAACACIRPKRQTVCAGQRGCVTDAITSGVGARGAPQQHRS